MDVREKVEQAVVGMKEARIKAGMTQEALARLVGTDRAVIAGYESAARTLKYRMAEKLSEHLDRDSAELVIANRLAAMRKAKEARDPAAVILAAKGILEIVGNKDLTAEGEAFLDSVTEEALEFAGLRAEREQLDAEIRDEQTVTDRQQGRFKAHAPAET